MIRVALRQFRTEAAIGFGLLAALAVVLLLTGPHLLQVNATFRHTCIAANDCGTALNPVVNVDRSLQSALPLIVTVGPALVGLFFGAPLIAREFETGTFRLAWTQSVTRRRWLAAKLALVGLGAMAIGGLLTWMVNWWASPLNAVDTNRFGLAQFGYHGIAPLGYAAFAFALGAAAGALLRRTIAAMAAMGIGFAAARVAVTYWIRPNFAAPLHKSVPLPVHALAFGFADGAGHLPYIEVSPVTIPNGWVYSTQVVDNAGRAPTSQYLLHACPILGQAAQAPPAAGKASAHGSGATQLEACIHKLSATLHTVVAYQPASRFWPFQWAETGVFLAAALALCAFTFWWLRRQYA